MLSIISFLIIIPPTLWSAATIADTHLLHGKGADSKPGSILAISSVFCLLLAGVILLILKSLGQELILTNALPIIANGLLTITAMWMYLYVLSHDGATRVLPWFQLIPLFGLILGIFVLKEIPNLSQIGGILLFIVGGFILSFENGKVNYRLLGFMSISSFLLASSDIIFAYYGRAIPDMSALFWDAMGKTFWCSMLLFVPQYRKGFRRGFKKKFAVQATAETLTATADLLFDWSKLRVPVAMSQATACSTPLIGLTIGLILKQFFPKMIHENIHESLGQKICGTLCVVGGGVMLAFF